MRIRKTASLLLARPKKTRHGDISNVETTTASVLEYKNDLLQYLIHYAGWHNDDSLVVEEDVITVSLIVE